MKTYEVTLKEVHEVTWVVEAETCKEANDYALQGLGDLKRDEYSHTLEHQTVTIDITKKTWRLKNENT